MSLFAVGAVADEAAAQNRDGLVDQVRAANARFNDVSVAVAEGYAPIPCASGVDGGAMGVHYVNANYLKDAIPDLKRPQAVMYEPTPDGKMALVAVEYITFKGPASLGGQLFNFNGAPNRYGLDPFYELHVWAWKANPSWWTALCTSPAGRRSAPWMREPASASGARRAPTVLGCSACRARGAAGHSAPRPQRRPVRIAASPFLATGSSTHRTTPTLFVSTGSPAR